MSVFPLFSRDFRGLVQIKNPCFLGGFPGHFQKKKKQGKEGQGKEHKNLLSGYPTRKIGEWGDRTELHALSFYVTLGKKKPININIFGGTVSGTNRNGPWDKWDPSPGQNGTRPWDKP